MLFLRPRSHGSSLCRTRVLTVLRKIFNTVAFVFAITSRRRLSGSILGFFLFFLYPSRRTRLTLYRQICAKNKFFFFPLNSFKLNLKTFQAFCIRNNVDTSFDTLILSIFSNGRRKERIKFVSIEIDSIFGLVRLLVMSVLRENGLFPWKFCYLKL